MVLYMGIGGVGLNYSVMVVIEILSFLSLFLFPENFFFFKLKKTSLHNSDDLVIFQYFHSIQLK